MRTALRAGLLAGLLAGMPGTSPGMAPGVAGAAEGGCRREVVEVPILSEEGAVIVPVEVNGVAAAAYVDPMVTPSDVWDGGGQVFHHGPPAPVRGLLGYGHGYWTRIEALRLGSATIAGLDVLTGPRRDGRTTVVDGRPLMMVIGADLLDGYVLVLDLPRRRMALIRDMGGSCPDPVAALPGRATVVRLEKGEQGQVDTVPVSIDGHALEMAVGLGSNDTLVGREEAERLGVSAAALAGDRQERLGAGGVRVGVRHRFGELRVGGFAVRGAAVDLQRDMAVDVLGLDFLKDKVALLDFPGRRMAFAVAGPPPVGGRGSGMGEVRSRDVDTSVEEPEPMRGR